MQLKMILATLLVFEALPVCAQVVPAATEGNFPLAVGSGFSSFDVDWGHGRMGGGTLWADWHLYTRTPFLQGISVEMEARDISLGGSPSQPNIRQDTAAGGLTYTWPHYRFVQPYGKFLMGLASMDFTSSDPAYKHDTRTFNAFGGGLQIRVLPHVWVRADYEYQIWASLLNGTPDPQGFTLGVMYDFSHGFRRR